MVLSSCGSGHNRKSWKAGQKSLFKSSKRAKKERENAVNLKIKIPDMDSSKIWGRLSRDTMTLCSQSICCLWNIACCDLERSFTQKFVFPAWGVCNLNYKLYFLCCRFLIPQSLKHWFTCDNESFSNRRGSFIYKMSSEAHTWAVIFNSCLPISNHVTTWLKRFIYLENSELNV